jgi:sugar-specific transcriptional regulator TrmB
MDKLIDTLKGVGLNDKEAKTYLVLLRLGPQPVSIIARKIDSNRSSCYPILERLMEKGFVEKVIRENNTSFRAVEPIYVLDQLKSKQYELETKIENLGLALKDFDQLKDGYEIRPKVVFFQDEAGLQNVLENTFTSSEPLRCYASLDELSAMLPNYMPRYYQKRVKHGLRVRAIYPATEKSFLHKKRDGKELRESRLIPAEFDFHLDIMIYDHKVVITSLKEKFGVMIESREMAESQKKIFDMIWKGTGEYDRQITDHYEKIFQQRFLDLQKLQKQKNDEVK